MHNRSSTYISGDTMTTIIVFSHLRWDFAYQRPQHLLTRLAENYKIVFIEEPVFHDGDSFFETSTAGANITVLKPHTPVAAKGFHDEQLPHLIKLMRQLVVLDEEHIAWFYTPMALPLLQELQPAAVIYDCIDELSACKDSPRQMLQRENALLKVADLVFSAGPSLYRMKRERHSNVHYFPGSVETAHFEQALDRSNTHPAHEDIPGPRLGFYGVIDERIDMNLIEALAEAHPLWQIVLVGPIISIEPAALPKRHNIHYLGHQPYEALPYLLAGWNVCLLPFALNESTRFTSPGKTLEYMAAGLPVVSTAIADVVELYGDVVSVAATPKEFIRACEQALFTTPEENKGQSARTRELLSATSWDTTAEKVHELIQWTSLAKDEQGPAVREYADALRVPRRTQPAMGENKRCIVMGTGPAGLSTAFQLDEDNYAA